MATLSQLDFYMVVLKPVTVFTGRVNGTPSDPYISIAWDGGATGTSTSVGTSGAPIEANTVWFGTSGGGRERGVVRLRDWTSSEPTGTTGTLKIAETDDVGPIIADDDHITVKLEWRLWGKVPRTDDSDTNNIILYEDYDVAFNNQTVDWLPLSVPGPPAVAFLEGGQAQVDFVGDRSKALAPGASLSSHLWTAHGSSEGTSTSQGTEASPVTFTWSSAGQYLVSFRETDSNGNSHTSYTWVFIIDPASPNDVAFTKFDGSSDSDDFFQGGETASFTVHADADTSEFPEEALVMVVARGNITTPTATWPNRGNVLFMGYIMEDTVNQDPLHGTISFRAVTIDGIMKNLPIYPVRLEDNANPQNWTQGKDLTVDRLISFLGHWRSTLSLMTSIVLLEDSAEIKSQDFGHSSLYSLMDGLMKDAWGKAASSHQSVLYLERDYQTMSASEKAAVTTRKTLHKGVWVGDVGIRERATWASPTRKVKRAGVYYPGDDAQAIPYFSEAPGDVQADFGNEDSKSGYILTTQSDLNIRTGNEFARQNQRYPAITMQFLNDGSFGTVPQELFPAVIEASDNRRGLALTPNLVPRQVRKTYNHQGGYFAVQVTFEPVATGEPGITVVMPAEPPSKTGGGVRPHNDPPLPAPAWSQPVVPLSGAVVASDKTKGVYWSKNVGQSWEARNTGLGGDQLDFEDLIWDPWWFTPSRKGTYDPEEVILLGCGGGFIARSNNAGKSWQDLTPNLGTPPNDWGDSPAPAATDLTYTQIRGDIHNLNTFYAAARWQTSGGDWRSWLLKTTDNWTTASWQSLRSISPINFSVTHEIGDLSEYDSTVEVGAGTVAATMAAAMNGTVYGLEASVSALNDEAQAIKNISTPTGSQFTLSFYFDPNSIAIPDVNPPFSGADVEVMHVLNSSGVLIGFIEMANDSGFKIRLAFDDDNSTRQFSSEADLSDEAHLIEVVFNKATTAVSNDGSILLKVDGTTETSLTNVDYFNQYVAIAKIAFGMNGVDAGISGSCYYDEADASFASATATDSYVMAITTDQKDGSRVYASVWKDGSFYLERFSSGLSLATSLSFATATIGETTAKTYFAALYPSALFDVTGYGETLWVFGRWDDGATKHIARSVNAGGTLSNVGDGSWNSERVGAFIATTESLWYAILNSGSPALWRTADGGNTWGNFKALQFSVEYEALTVHGSGRLLVANNMTGAAQATWVDTPYDTSSLIDATGPAGSRLPGAGDGGSGISAIIFVA